MIVMIYDFYVYMPQTPGGYTAGIVTNTALYSRQQKSASVKMEGMPGILHCCLRRYFFTIEASGEFAVNV